MSTIEPRVIEASEDMECCCCLASNVRLHVFEGHYQHQHCDVCYETLIGTLCCASSHPSRDVGKMIAGAANILLRELRERLWASP